ncbi:hypothetical protein BpHYR1_028761 [Brachionus plicatilis]|uniref:Uncharacterized protein n=1 Tax=Brachionus plicatilis TaxID=10195 RepID=A0A3M7RS75_BRAPC|nr:hypothetical protein BpHYR1_028761 [Brachionus plicatilis]
MSNSNILVACNKYGADKHFILKLTSKVRDLIEFFPSNHALETWKRLLFQKLHGNFVNLARPEQNVRKDSQNVEMRQINKIFFSNDCDHLLIKITFNRKDKRKNIFLD